MFSGVQRKTAGSTTDLLQSLIQSSNMARSAVLLTVAPSLLVSNTKCIANMERRNGEGLVSSNGNLYMLTVSLFLHPEVTYSNGN